MDLVTIELWLEALLLVRTHNPYREKNEYSLNNIFQEIHRFLVGKRGENNYIKLFWFWFLPEPISIFWLTEKPWIALGKQIIVLSPKMLGKSFTDWMHHSQIWYVYWILFWSPKALCLPAHCGTFPTGSNIIVRFIPLVCALYDSCSCAWESSYTAEHRVTGTWTLNECCKPPTPPLLKELLFFKMREKWRGQLISTVTWSNSWYKVLWTKRTSTQYSHCAQKGK